MECFQELLDLVESAINCPMDDYSSYSPPVEFAVNIATSDVSSYSPVTVSLLSM